LSFAAIYLRQTNKRLDHPYDYIIPEQWQSQVKPGVRVVVPFGKGARRTEGFVVDVLKTSEFKGHFRAIEAIIDDCPVLNGKQLKLCRWMVDRYHCLFYDALSLFTNPVKVQTKMRRNPDGTREKFFDVYADPEKWYRLTPEGSQATSRGKTMGRIMALLSSQPMTAKDLKQQLGNISSSLRSLRQKGWVEEVNRRELQMEQDHAVGENAFKSLVSIKTSPSLKKIKQCLEENAGTNQRFPIFFYHQNKREKWQIFLALAMGLEAKETGLLLLPNKYFLEQFAEMLTPDEGAQILFYHGELSQSSRRRAFDDVREGRFRFVVGTRAALFLPYRHLKWMIMDEESDSSYVSGGEPHYHTRILAEKYVTLLKASLIVSDTVPSVDATHRIMTHRMRLISESSFETKYHLRIVNMQDEMHAGNLNFISHALAQAVTETLGRGKNVLIMHNRLGYETYVFCRDCGHVARCPECEKTLRTDAHGHLMCPTCGKRWPMPSTCPVCGGHRYRPMGLGIDQVVAEIERRWPAYPVFKLDAQGLEASSATTVKQALADGVYRIVVGTHALLNVSDYPEVGLCAAALIDVDLNQREYNALERAYQQYVAFFSRGEGSALLQTYDPAQDLVRVLASGVYRDFYQSEIRYRKAMAYPPYGHLIFFKIFGKEAKQVEKDSQMLYHWLQGLNQQRQTVYRPVKMNAMTENQQAMTRIVVKTQSIGMVSRYVQKLIRNGYFEKLPSKIAMVMDPV
jgi:primosomal protein N' (replication factor Y)